MAGTHPGQGIGTLVNHLGEVSNPMNAHIEPIYETSSFYFPDVDSGAAFFRSELPGYTYSRLNNPNQRHLAEKIAYLEGLDLLRRQPARPAEEVVAGSVFATGMAAVTGALLARLQTGDIVIAQEAIYSASYKFFTDLAPRYGIQVVWVSDPSPAGWEAAFQTNPTARLAYAETPVNPTLDLVDLQAAAEIAHRFGAWLMVDNTFATPYCQRPLTWGADVVVLSTTKYISGHGLIVGGAVVSPHLDYMNNDLRRVMEIQGGTPSPFDTWLVNIGLKTFELRMRAHCANAMQVARFLEAHPAVERVFYPGLDSHPAHALARRQMLDYGGMVAFELKGGVEAGIGMMNRVRLCTLTVSLGNTDTLICHPASSTHIKVPREARLKMGISDGLVRLSVGVENVEDILADLDQAMGRES